MSLAGPPEVDEARAALKDIAANGNRASEGPPGHGLEPTPLHPAGFVNSCIPTMAREAARPQQPMNQHFP
jgi:hypothetical protein